MIDEESKRIVKENKAILEDLDSRLSRIERRFTWNTIFGFIKAFFILAPIILGVIYLTPILKDYIRIFEPLFKNLNLPIISQNTDIQAADTQVVPDNVDSMLQSFCDPEAREAMVRQLCP